MNQISDEDMRLLIRERVRNAFREHPGESRVLVDFADLLAGDGGPTKVWVEAGAWFGAMDADEAFGKQDKS